MIEVIAWILAVGFVAYWVVKVLVWIGWIIVNSRDDPDGRMG